jgi:hypothetical protein
MSGPTSLRLLLGALAALAASAPALALADDEACLAAHADGQRARKQGQLIQARRNLLVCAAAGCPSLVTADCATWVAEVERDIPSLLPVLRDADGRELVEVHVSVDGRPARDRIDGVPIEVDPGPHRVRLETSDAAVDVEVVARAGEKNRVVSAQLPRAAASSDDLRTAAWVTGGVGVGALALFGALAIAGQVRYDELDACRPRCAEEDEEGVATTFLIADLSLGVGLAAVGAAVVLFVVSAPGDEATAIRVTPAIGPQGAGVAARAAF